MTTFQKEFDEVRGIQPVSYHCWATGHVPCLWDMTVCYNCGEKGEKMKGWRELFPNGVLGPR